MTAVQKLDLERSEARQALAELNGQESPEIAEVRKASDALADVEKRYREAVRQEVESRPEPDAEAREFRALEGRSRLGRFLGAAAFGSTLDGAEAEYRKALGLQERHVPIDMFAPVESRAVTVPAAGDQAQAMRPTLDRVFSRSDLAFLGTTMESVGPGQPVYPVVTAGPSAAMTAKGTDVADGSLTIAATKISPNRLSISSSWDIEDEAAFGEIESVVRRDLSMAMSDELDDQVLTGDGTSPNLAGLFDDDSGLVAPTGDFEASAENTFQSYATQFAEGIDGENAYGLGDLRALVGIDTLKHMEGKFRGTDGPISAASYMGQRLGALRASKRVPAVASSKQEALVSRMNGAAVLAVWRGVEAIRDPYTDARKGGIRLTLNALYGFEVVRANGWYRTSFQVEA